MLGIEKGNAGYTFHVTVHVYAEEKLDDRVLTLHSKNYGIIGKEIIAPLRRINGKEFYIEKNRAILTVRELWDWIDYKLYGSNSQGEGNDTYKFVREYGAVKKYLIFNNLRYKIADIDRSLSYYLRRMNISETEIINIQLLVNANAGTIFKDDGIRYYMYSKEYGDHHTAHVHVDIRHEESGVFSIIDGTQLSKGKIKKRDINKIKDMIAKERDAFVKYWNEHTDGLTVDLNQALGLIHY